MLEPEPEPETEPEPEVTGAVQLQALCSKQKPKMRTWHERHARIMGPGLFFFDSEDASTDGVLEEPRGSSIADVAGCTVDTGLEVFTFSEVFPAKATWFNIQLRRADLQGDGVSTIAFKDERTRDEFAMALSNLAAGLAWDAGGGEEEAVAKGKDGVVVRTLSRGSLSFKFPDPLLEPVPVNVKKGEPALDCTEDSLDPCCAVLSRLGLASLQLRDTLQDNRVLALAYSHRIHFQVTRPGNFEFTDASNKTHTTRRYTSNPHHNLIYRQISERLLVLTGATTIGMHTHDFNSEEPTLTQLRRRTEAEQRREVRRQWPQLDAEVDVWSATAQGWVAGVVVESDDVSDDVTVLYTVAGEKRGKTMHKNDRDHLRMRMDTPRDSAAVDPGGSESSLPPPDSPRPMLPRAVSDSALSVSDTVSGGESPLPGRVSATTSASASLRISWATEDLVPEDSIDAFEALLPRLPGNVSSQWLRNAGGGPLHEGWLENETLGRTLPVVGKFGRDGSGAWSRWYCILWPREVNPTHGRLLVCFEDRESEKGPVEVIRLQDPCVIPPRNSREPYYALRLEAAQVKDYNPERADELRSTGNALTGTAGPLLERRKKWILGLKEQSEMEAWVRHIPLHLPYLRKEPMGWESEGFSRQRSNPRAAPAVEDPGSVSDSNPRTSSSNSLVIPDPLTQVRTISGKLNPHSEWTELSSGGYGTVYRASWMGAPVAVKVLNRTHAAKLPVLMKEWEPEKVTLVCEIVRQSGEDLFVKLGEQGVRGLGIPVVVAYCRAITARSTHRQDFEKEVEIIYNCQHPFVVRCYGVYSGISPLSQQQEVMLVMDVADRGSLWNFLRQKFRTNTGGTLGPPLPTRVNIANGIAAGIGFLHGGERALVHLDLKSLNILISGDGRPKICDFGAAQSETAIDDSSFVSTMRLKLIGENRPIFRPI